MSSNYYLQRASQKWEAAVRFGLIKALSGTLPYYVVNEYPKSGGTWIGQMLGEALKVPFPRNRMPMLRSSIMHGHYYRSTNLKNVVMVWRDPRDLMISLYYHCYFKNERSNGLLVEMMRRKLPFKSYNHLGDNLPVFLEHVMSGRVGWPRHTWQAFANQWWSSKSACHVTYEDMRAQPQSALSRVILQLTGREMDSDVVAEAVEKFSFERQSGRKPGESNNSSFVRNGVVGDWKHHFNRESREVLEYYAGRELRLLGYEADGSWVARCK